MIRPVIHTVKYSGNNETEIKHKGKKEKKDKISNKKHTPKQKKNEQRSVHDMYGLGLVTDSGSLPQLSLIHI